jgi:hypothetical protein
MRYSARIDRDRWALGAALLLPPAIAAVFLPWRSSLAPSDIALLLVVAIVAVAADGNRPAGILTAASAALWFDFFWTKPYGHFSISSSADIRTTVLLLTTGIAVSELAARARRARRTVVYDTAYLAELRTMARLVKDGRDPLEVAQRVRAQLVILLGLREARFEQNRILGHPPELTDDGTLRWRETRWNLDEFGFPDEEIQLRVHTAGHTYGRFMLTPVPGTRPSLDARQVAAMLAALTGMALAQQAGATGPAVPAS